MCKRSLTKWVWIMVSRLVGVPNDASTFSCGHSLLQDLHLWQEWGWEDLSGCTSGRHECSQHALWNKRWVPDQHWQGRFGVQLKKWGQNLFLRYWDNDGVLAGETERRWESSFLLFAAVGLWRKCTAQIWPFPPGRLILPAQKNNQKIHSFFCLPVLSGTGGRCSSPFLLHWQDVIWRSVEPDHAVDRDVSCQSGGWHQVSLWIISSVLMLNNLRKKSETLP